jgi:hypothetical protein
MSGSAIMIHGMWGGPWCWAGYRSLLRGEGWRCVAPALPCHDADPRASYSMRVGIELLRPA